MFNTVNPESFKINLSELHCIVYVLFILDIPYDEQLNLLYLDLDKLNYFDDDNKQNLIDELNKVLADCSNNPGFTFELSDVLVAIALKVKHFKNETFGYFMNTLTHEISHAVTKIFDMLGILLEDDEMRAIEIGNITEECINHIDEANIIPLESK